MDRDKSGPSPERHDRPDHTRRPLWPSSGGPSFPFSHDNRDTIQLTTRVPSIPFSWWDLLSHVIT